MTRSLFVDVWITRNSVGGTVTYGDNGMINDNSFYVWVIARCYFLFDVVGKKTSVT